MSIEGASIATTMDSMGVVTPDRVEVLLINAWPGALKKFDCEPLFSRG